MSRDYVSSLAADVRQKRSPLVLGIDPRPDAMPRAFQNGGSLVSFEGIWAFYDRLMELLQEHVVAVKPQIAFFEVLGTDGLRLYADVCQRARDRGLLVIGDVKRGDIGSTAEAYARAHFMWADCLTVNPYLGEDSIVPFLGYCRGQPGAASTERRGLFVLCVTSNPSWAQFQGYEDADGHPLYLEVASAIRRWNSTCLAEGERYGPIGAVVGATHPVVLERVRAALPSSWLLCPGVGAQGGQIEALAEAFDDEGLGVLVPVSRGFAQCFAPEDPDWERLVVSKADEMLQTLRRSIPGLA